MALATPMLNINVKSEKIYLKCDQKITTPKDQNPGSVLWKVEVSIAHIQVPLPKKVKISVIVT